MAEQWGNRGVGDGSLVEQARRVMGVTEKPAAVINEPAPDGYIRRTPVQEMRVPEDYKTRMIKRMAATAAAVIFASVVLYVFLRAVF